MTILPHTYPLPSLSSHCSDIVGVREGELFPKVRNFKEGEAITLTLPDPLGISSVPADRLHYGIPMPLTDKQKNNLQWILTTLCKICNEGYKREKQPIKPDHQSSTHVSLHTSILDRPTDNPRSL